MVRRKSQRAAEKEALVLQALDDIKSGKYKSAYEAARELSLTVSTVYRRLQGHSSRSTARTDQQLLSEAEEYTILKWIKQLSRCGYPVNYKLLGDIASEVLVHRVGSINTPDQKLVQYSSIGKNWVPRFIQRHSSIKSVIGRRIEVNRMDGASKDALIAWFDAFEETIKAFKIDFSNIYNMDETGFAIGSMESTRIIVESSSRTYWQANPGRQEWISVVECICADGTFIDPMVIFKGNKPQTQWIPPCLHGKWSFSTNSKGWTSNVHGLEWLTEIFEPSTRDKAQGQTRLLICDGHDSHISGNFIVHCMNNNIQVLVLPPHTSHILQPLDVAIFGPLKKALTTTLSPYHEAQLSRIQKAEWVEAYDQARNMTFTPQNIASAWRGAGLVPLDRKKALRYLQPEQIVEEPAVRTPPSSPTKMIFNSVYLNSSSPEYGALQRANKALQEHIAVLQTPVRTFLMKMASQSERNSTRKIIHNHELKALRSIVNKRRDVKKGKRAVLKGNFRITIEELRDGVLTAEQDSATRENKKRKKSKKTANEVNKARLEDTESLEEAENSEIQDCIVVAMK